MAAFMLTHCFSANRRKKRFTKRGFLVFKIHINKNEKNQFTDLNSLFSIKADAAMN